MIFPNDEAISSRISLTDFYTKTCSFCREEALILGELTRAERTALVEVEEGTLLHEHRRRVCRVEPSKKALYPMARSTLQGARVKL